jgi:hypothetical protein
MQTGGDCGGENTGRAGDAIVALSHFILSISLIVLKSQNYISAT